MEKSDGSVVSEIDVTELRKNPTYAIYYNCWARIIITGLIPIVLLIYFNYKVYKDVTVSFLITSCSFLSLHLKRI